MLRDELGSNWREKLPVPGDHEAVIKGQQTSAPAVVPMASHHQASGGTAVTSPEAKPSAELTKEQQFKMYEEVKERGNGYVKKVQYNVLYRGKFW